VTRVLWVDDQADVARTLARDISDCSIEFAVSADEAISTLADRFFDLVLLDLAMPPGVWGGLWLLEEMKTRELFTPVIVISGEGAQAETIMAIRLGATDYVTKESAPRELADRVHHAIRQASSLLDNIRRRPTRDLIGGGETKTVEFKETARWDVRRQTRDSRIEHEIVKTVAGLFNSAGGTLFVGVKDDGQVVGIGPDLELFGAKRDPRDSFTSWLTDLLAQAVGAADAALVKIRLEPTESGRVVCRIDVPAGGHPVFMANDDDAFFVRYENSTRRLSPREAIAYVAGRWPGARGGR
jgi:DNA-binding response OmpR family regulator